MIVYWTCIPWWNKVIITINMINKVIMSLSNCLDTNVQNCKHFFLIYKVKYYDTLFKQSTFFLHYLLKTEIVIWITSIYNSFPKHPIKYMPPLIQVPSTHNFNPSHHSDCNNTRKCENNYNLFQQPWDFLANFRSFHWKKQETLFARLDLIIEIDLSRWKKGQLGKKVLLSVLRFSFFFFNYQHTSPLLNTTSPVPMFTDISTYSGTMNQTRIDGDSMGLLVSLNSIPPAWWSFTLIAGKFLWIIQYGMQQKLPAFQSCCDL